MKIGSIGSGNMGRSLGILWAEQGHDVFFGARTTDKGRDIAVMAGHNTQGGSNDEAAAFGKVLLYTVRGMNPAEVFSSISLLDDKILIGCNNQEIPEDFAHPAITRSLAEKLAAEVPNARVVKRMFEKYRVSPEPPTLREASYTLALSRRRGNRKLTPLLFRGEGVGDEGKLLILFKHPLKHLIQWRRNYLSWLQTHSEITTFQCLWQAMMCQQSKQ